MDLQKYGQQIDEAKKNPYILHFSTRYKPWHEDCFHPLKNEFLKYKNMTEWKNVPLERKYYPKRQIKAILGDILRIIYLRTPVQKKESSKFFID